MLICLGLRSSPTTDLDEETARNALDELFRLTFRYRSATDYADLLGFMRRFRGYAPFNAMLIHVQMPGARFVAAAHCWQNQYRQKVRLGAHPLVILQPIAVRRGTEAPQKVETAVSVSSKLPKISKLTHFPSHFYRYWT